MAMFWTNQQLHGGNYEVGSDMFDMQSSIMQIRENQNSSLAELTCEMLKQRPAPPLNPASLFINPE